jgi:polysaccharide deacetylase 2 family uncharacterized protein YibQ
LKNNLAYKIAIAVLTAIIILEGIFIIMTRPRKMPRVPVALKGKIAVVLDDWGYNLNNLEILDQIKYPLTVAILPNLSYSRAIAREAHGRGLEIILHLPMEPREKYRLEKNTIMTYFSKEAVENIVDEDLKNIVYAKGVSNHMGSHATQDPRTMEIVFKNLKRRNLYFLDSLVSSQSVCSDLARRMGLGFVRRDVFLDNKEEAAYIKSQLHKLKLAARVKGQAIGIGHDRRLTLEVLKEAMPELEKEGYRFVFLSELVR